jgi:hypothetical protein
MDSRVITVEKLLAAASELPPPKWITVASGT